MIYIRGDDDLCHCMWLLHKLLITAYEDPA